MKSLEEIHQIREEKRKELDLRVNTKADTREKHILVCHGTGCTSSKSPEILTNFRKIITTCIHYYVNFITVELNLLIIIIKNRKLKRS